MGSLFSKKPAGPPKPQITKKDEAILQLKVQTDNMKKYQARLEIVVEKETQAAKSLALAGKQRQAILALKKKKYQEALINKTDNMLLNLQEMISTIQFKEIESKVMDGLAAGNECLKQLQRELSVEDVERIMADTEDAIAYQQEIETAMGSRLTAEDEDDVERELAALEAEMTGAALPVVPTDALPEPATPAEPAAAAAAAPARRASRGDRVQLAA